MDGGSTSDGEPRVSKLAHEVIDIFPEEAFEKTRTRSLIAALDGFQEKESIWFQDLKYFLRDAFNVERVIHGIGINDIDRPGRELKIVKIAMDHIAVVGARIEIDPDSERAEVEKCLHLRPDARRETESISALPFDVESRQALPESGAEFGVVLAKVVRLEFRLLVFQVGVVGIVAALLEGIIRSVPALAELPEKGSLSQGTL
jgi:hypothetical protein